MKQKQRSLSRFQAIPQKVLASLKGGDTEEDEIIYIDGKPYRIKTNKDGTTVFVPIGII